MRIYTKPSVYWRILAQMLTGHWQKGDTVKELERVIENRIDVAHAITMPMARTAIFYAVQALISPGQKVVLSPYTIVDVVNMVICAGGIPVFADLSPGSCNVSAVEIERLVDDETGAVMVTHFYGEACDIERIAEFCKEHSVPLIEDAAQAFGVSVGGRQLGTFGDIGIFSFGMYKVVNAFYGGMLITNRSDIAEAVRRGVEDVTPEPASRYLPKVLTGFITDILTWPPFFRVITFRFLRWAYLNDIAVITNQMKIDVDPQLKRTIPDSYLHRMSPLQAELILAQLDGIDAMQEQRVSHAKRYQRGLEDIQELTLPPLRADGSHGYAYYCIACRDREKLVAYAQRHGRDIQESYHRNCAALECFDEYRSDCRNAEEMSNSVICVPSYPRYPVIEVDRTISVIRAFFTSPG